MEMSQIKQQFAQVEQSIQQAAKALQSDGTAPQELKDCVRELDTQSKQAHTLVEQGDDEEGIQQCIEEMEEIGDRAKDACEEAPKLSPQVKTAVMQAHQKISKLKHQLLH